MSFPSLLGRYGGFLDGITTTAFAAKGLDVSDRHLKGSMVYQAVQALCRWEKQGQVVRSRRVVGR